MEALTGRFEVPARCGKLEVSHRGNERQGIDLAVGVVKRDADLFALVLEYEDVADVRTRTECLVAIRPDVDQKPDPFHGKPSESQRVIRRVDDDLASGARRMVVTVARIMADRGEPVLEHDHLEVIERDLGIAFRTRRAQRAESGGKEGAVVPFRVVGDPFLTKRIEAQLRHGCPGGPCDCKRRDIDRPSGAAPCAPRHRSGCALDLWVLSAAVLASASLKCLGDAHVDAH